MSTHTPFASVTGDFSTFMANLKRGLMRPKSSRHVAYLEGKQPLFSGQSTTDAISAQDFYTLSRKNHIKVITDLVEKISRAIDLDESWEPPD